MTKSRADELRERQQRRAASTTPTPPADPEGSNEPPSEPSPEVMPPAVPKAGQTLRVKPVKVTVELQPMEHRGLTRMAQRYAEELQLPLVAGAEVFRVLLDLLQRDEDLAERVGQELARTGGTRRR